MPMSMSSIALYPSKSGNSIDSNARGRSAIKPAVRASIYLVLGTSLAFAAGYLVLRSKGIAATQPAMTRTLADGQQRREVDRIAPSVRESASTPTQETLTGKNNPIGRLADAEGQLDRSMVGLPFALSKSVTE